MRGVRCGVKVERTLCESSYIRKCAAQMLIKQRMQWTKLKRQHSEHSDSTGGSLSSVSPLPLSMRGARARIGVMRESDVCSKDSKFDSSRPQRSRRGGTGVDKKIRDAIAAHNHQKLPQFQRCVAESEWPST
jgi:hypothetical protein